MVGEVAFAGQVGVSGGVEEFYHGFPSINDFYLRAEDVAFEKFTVISSSGYKSLEPTPNTYNSIFSVFINTLRESNIPVEIITLRDQKLGKYTGPGSSHHKVSHGDAVAGDMLVVKVPRNC